MSRFHFLSPNLSAFLTTLLFVLLSFNSSSSAPPEARIVGGTQCFVDEHPFIVLIVFRQRKDWKQVGGTLIHPKWVLSIAINWLIFLKSGFDPVEIRAGSSVVERDTPTDHRPGEELQVRRLSNVYFHDSDVRSLSIHDIALIELDDAFDLNDGVGLAELPQPQSGPDQFCPETLMMGWGGTEVVDSVQVQASSYSHSKWLQCLELSMVAASFCESSSNIVDEILCAKFDEKGIGKCMGDNGGPIVCTDQPNVVIGIVKQAGLGGCGMGNYSVYTRVDAYVEWILEHVPNDEVKQRKLEDGEYYELELNGSEQDHVAYVWLVLSLLINVIFFYSNPFISSQSCDPWTGLNYLK